MSYTMNQKITNLFDTLVVIVNNYNSEQTYCSSDVKAKTVKQIIISVYPENK